ncbi:protein quiver-like [Macrosteles quadrilineatus]|uniref:protein quiver-like n=1 Tax=Macrosteles quadrilineatus TaxID=74068 RepID=UPI0023E221B0|nr:protein quiver-like [Macrosteles quadrilineatus]
MMEKRFMSVFVFSVTSVFLSSIGSADAIKCYECNSYNDSRCSDEVPPTETEINCTTVNNTRVAYVLCRKIVQSVNLYKLPSDSRVIRSCGWENSSHSDSCYLKSGEGYSQEVCSCTSDLCNSSDTLSSIFGVLAVTLSLMLCCLCLP